MRRRVVSPKTAKKPIQKDCASARSSAASAHSLAKAIARALISFQLSGMAPLAAAHAVARF